MVLIVILFVKGVVFLPSVFAFLVLIMSVEPVATDGGHVVAIREMRLEASRYQAVRLLQGKRDLERARLNHHLNCVMTRRSSKISRVTSCAGWWTSYYANSQVNILFDANHTAHWAEKGRVSVF